MVTIPDDRDPGPAGNHPELGGRGVTRVALLDDYQDVALSMADWKSLPAGTEVVVFKDHLAAENAVARRLADFDIVMALRERTPFPRTLLERLPKLKLLITAGMRNASIDMKAAAERGVIVCGTAGLPYPTAELAWGLILALMRRIPAEDRAVRVGGAFEMQVLAWSANLTAERAAEVGATLVSKDELLARSDIVSIHLVLSDRTRGLLGARELGLMK